jgi:periplasmic protein TonB
MKTELILKSDILDIVFENRNKAYGAYNLRKFYDNRLMKSLAIMIAVVTVLSAFTFIPKKKIALDNNMFEVKTGYLPPAKEKTKETEKQKETAKAKEKPVNTKKDVANIVIIKDPKLADTIQTIKEKDKIGSVNITKPDNGNPGVIEPLTGDGGDGKGKNPEPVKPAIDINTPVYEAEIMPSYPGGVDALRKFLQRNLTNPKDMEEGEEVSVKVKFVVGYNGKLQSFVTVQDGGEEFNKEVVRVLKKMPEWVPGKSNGQNISVYYTIPVKFVAAN